MFPREHLPLALVTVALVGILFIMYRELNALKTAVAHLSVPTTPVIETLAEEEGEEDDVEEEKKTPTDALKSSKKNNS